MKSKIEGRDILKFRIPTNERDYSCDECNNKAKFTVVELNEKVSVKNAPNVMIYSPAWFWCGIPHTGA